MAMAMFKFANNVEGGPGMLQWFSCTSFVLSLGSWSSHRIFILDGRFPFRHDGLPLNIIIHVERWYFPLYKPSSYGGIPIYGNPYMRMGQNWTPAWAGPTATPFLGWCCSPKQPCIIPSYTCWGFYITFSSFLGFLMISRNSKNICKNGRHMTCSTLEW